MKVLGRDPERGDVKLRLDTMDDLWHLSELVEDGDVASALTYRTADVEAKGAVRAGKAEKRPVYLGVRVEKTEYQAFTSRLRLLGPIVEGPQDVGSYHALSLEPGSEIALRKARGFRPHHEARLQEAVTATARPVVTLLSIEENEAVIAQLRQYGVHKLADVVGHTSGKRHASSGRDEEDFFDEILLALRSNRAAGTPLLIVGPGFSKERFLRYAREKESATVQGAAVEATGQAGMTGIHEALKKGIVDRVAKDQRIARESVLVERLFEAIAADRPVAYGIEETRRTAEAGAADVILVTDRLLREGPGETLLDIARDTGAQAHVVSTIHEAGLRLEGLGGAGALLRYKPA